MKLSFIVAMDQNRGIGYQNQLPWHMPADLAYFKQKTLGKPIIMGRKTYESIGRPLPKRRNIIITRDKDYQVQGCDVFNDIDAALHAVDDCDEAVVIGGANLFNQMINKADTFYLTKIHHQFEVDTYLDQVDFSTWQEVEKIENQADEKNPHNYTFITYQRD